MNRGAALGRASGIVTAFPSLTIFDLTMKPSFLLLLLLTLAAAARADQVLQYEPAVVEVSGTITKGKEQHPNGSWFDFQLIKLDQPASIKGDDSKDSIDVSEPHITEIQAYSNDAAIRKKISQLTGKEAVLKGTLFHSHTAWHVRDLVMMVTEVRAAK
jgi:hypothetical protein